MTTEHIGTERQNAAGTGAESHGILPEPALTERAQIVAFMREAIEQGYPSPTGAGARSECEHGKFRWEDCIACYDEHLWSKLDAIERGDHMGEQPE